jgi:hypothetical protein
MKKSDVVYILSAVFMASTSLFYCCTMWFGIKLPRYYPLEHAWKWVSEKGVPSQGWYGMQGFAFLGAGIVTLAIWIGLTKRSSSSQDNLRAAHIKLCGAIAILVVVVCMGYMLYHEFSRWGVFALMGL